MSYLQNIYSNIQQLNNDFLYIVLCMYATQEIQYAKCFYRAVKGTEFCTLSKQIFNFISGEVEKNNN